MAEMTKEEKQAKKDVLTSNYVVGKAYGFVARLREEGKSEEEIRELVIKKFDLCDEDADDIIAEEKEFSKNFK